MSRDITFLRENQLYFFLSVDWLNIASQCPTLVDLYMEVRLCKSFTLLCMFCLLLFHVCVFCLLLLFHVLCVSSHFSNLSDPSVGADLAVVMMQEGLAQIFLIGKRYVLRYCVLIYICLILRCQDFLR